MSAVLSTVPHKRERRTRARLDQLDAQILDVLAVDHPQSVRHVFYRMTDPRLPEPVEKSDKGYRHVQYRCAQLRRDGKLPYAWIADATRRGHFTFTYSDKADFLRQVAGLYRGHLWEQTPYICELWVESRSLAGVVQGLCRELAVDLYPCGGFSSMTFAYEAAQGINETADGREVRIFYVGDYDPAGVIIDVALERELRAHLRPDIDMSFERLGITREQIERLDLPTKPRKDADRRALHVEATVEAEAMPAADMRALIRGRIEALLPPGALEAVRETEESERLGLESLARALQAQEHQP
jgi:hypothetical protein